MMVIKEDSQSKKPGSGAIVNEDLVEELHKPVNTTFKRRFARFLCMV